MGSSAARAKAAARSRICPGDWRVAGNELREQSEAGPSVLRDGALILTIPGAGNLLFHGITAGQNLRHGTSGW